MKLSWSHKLFFAINRRIGKRPWLDAVMKFCARYLIGFLGIGFLLWLWLVVDFVPRGAANLNRAWLNFFVVICLLSFLSSYAIAIMWKHSRPIKEFPEIKVLISTLGTWKSFPSDHTIVATLFVIGIMLFGGPLWLLAAFIVGGLLVACSRVYVGVHYPRDIIGGIGIPFFFFIGVFLLFLSVVV